MVTSPTSDEVDVTCAANSVQLGENGHNPGPSTFRTLYNADGENKETPAKYL